MTDAVLSTDLRLGHRTAQSTDLSGLLCRDLGTAICHSLQSAVVPTPQAGAVGVGVVLPASNPLKVLDGVIRLVSVYVIDLKCRIVNWVKCVSDKAMNHELLMSSTTLKGDSQVATPNNNWFQNSSWPRPTSATGTPYPAERTHLVGPTIYGFPYFHGIDFLNFTENRQPVINFSRGIKRND